MTVRPTTQADLPALLAIYNDEVEHGCATFDLHPKEMSEWNDWYAEHRVGNHIALTAELDGMPVGYATLSAYRTKEAYAATVELSVYVARQARRRGVATRLLEEILRIAREDPQTHCVVSVITGGNEASVSLHERFGFSYCGTLREVGEKFGKQLDIVHYQLLV